jgi:hypothetical protein
MTNLNKLVAVLGLQLAVLLSTPGCTNLPDAPPDITGGSGTFRNLIVTDDLGRPRAILRASIADGVRVTLLDAAGHSRLDLGLDALDSPHVTITDADGHPRISFLENQGDYSVSAINSAGEGRAELVARATGEVGVYARSESVGSVSIATSREGQLGLRISRQGNGRRVQLSIQGDNDSGLTFSDKDGVSRIWIASSELEPNGICIADAKSNVRANCGVDPTSAATWLVLTGPTGTAKCEMRLDAKENSFATLVNNSGDGMALRSSSDRVVSLQFLHALEERLQLQVNEAGMGGVRLFDRQGREVWGEPK